MLKQYSWPGNVRQLESVVRNLAYRVGGPVVRENDVCEVLPEATGSIPGLTRVRTLISERARFEDALRQSNGFRDQAATLLGLSRATFFRKAKELGLIRARAKSGLEL